MLFCIFRIDRAGAAASRGNLRQAHLEHLRRHDEAILFAGPLRHAGNEGEAGSLYVVKFASLQAAEKFAQEDPFTQADLFITTEVRHFSATYGPLGQVLEKWSPKNS